MVLGHDLFPVGKLGGPRIVARGATARLALALWSYAVFPNLIAHAWASFAFFGSCPKTFG